MQRSFLVIPDFVQIYRCIFWPGERGICVGKWVVEWWSGRSASGFRLAERAGYTVWWVRLKPDLRAFRFAAQKTTPVAN